MPDFGMKIYDINEEGNLSGIYANTSSKRGDIIHEIATKPKAEKGLNGVYNVAWIDGDGTITGKLFIDNGNDPNKISYTLRWVAEGTIKFKGVGLQIGEKKLVATYWKGNSLTL